jgi:hypothetical protein
MQEVFTGRHQPLYKMAKLLLLRPIATDDFATFIKRRCEETGQAISDEAITHILAITEGHPHNTQELCYFTWALAQGERIAVIDVAVVDQALVQVLDAESAHYTMLWEGLAAHQRLVLVALASESRPVYSEEYRRRHRLGAVSSVQKSIARLVARELIEQVPGNGYRIADTFLRAWIGQRATP